MILRSALLLFCSLFAAPAWAICPNPAAPIPGTTNNAYYFLTEVGGCDCLDSFLDNLTFSPHAYATLVIDQQCTVNDTLVIPRRMTIAGAGIEGQGILYFPTLGAEQPAIRVAAPDFPGQDAYVTIRDLNIVGPNGDPAVLPTGRGIELVDAHITRLQNIRVHGFRYGVFGVDSYSVIINGSNISNNRQNIRVGANCNSWRVRDNLISRAYGWGVYVSGPNDRIPEIGSNDLLLDGNRFESNQMGAVRLGSEQVIVTHNRFESNNFIGVQIEAAGVGNRILANVFSSDGVIDAGVDTQCAFNTGLIPGC